MVGLWPSAEASWYRAQLELPLRGGSAWGSHPAQWWSTYTSGPWLLSPPEAADSTAAPGSVSVQPRLCGHGGSLGGRTCLAVLAGLAAAARGAEPPQATLGWELGGYRHRAGSGTAPGEAAFRQSHSKGTSLQVRGLTWLPAAELCPAPSQLPMWDGDV